ncbi:hypothetical protein KKF84_08235 [Myxococcota bacterium]|nr:hypothetical protein [Myxococcota bacterium]MBU1535296.1 hypothetical protein [Myxococcota bacterium]
MKLGQILLNQKAITADQLAICLWIQRVWGGPLGRILLSRGYISEDQLVHALSFQLDIPIIRLSGREIPESIVSLIPLSVCEQYLVLPFGRVPESGVVQIAMADPLNVAALERCQHHLDDNVQVFLAGFIDITECMWYNFKTNTRTGSFLLSEIRAMEELHASRERTTDPIEITEAEILSELPVGSYGYPLEEDAYEEISDVDDIIEEEISLVPLPMSPPRWDGGASSDEIADPAKNPDSKDSFQEFKTMDESEVLDSPKEPAISSPDPGAVDEDDCCSELELADFDEIEELGRKGTALPSKAGPPKKPGYMKKNKSNKSSPVDEPTGSKKSEHSTDKSKEHTRK